MVRVCLVINNKHKALPLSQFDSSLPSFLILEFSISHRPKPTTNINKKQVSCVEIFRNTKTKSG